MDRDIALKVKDALEGIETSFVDIATSLATIATNTTPSEEPVESSNVIDSRDLEELEEQEETKGGNK